MASVGAAAVSPDALGVKTPTVPGDIGLSGAMPAEVVQQLAPMYKGWLFLLDPSDPTFHADELRAGGCTVECVHCEAPSSWDVAKLLAAIDSLPRPLMLQCNSGTRASAAMLLWLAKKHGHNKTSAALLAKDMDLPLLKKDVIRDGVFQLVDELHGSSDGKGLSITQFYEETTSTYTYLLGCQESKKAVLIDPVLGEQARDLAKVDELGLDLQYVINTHVHADHITSGSAIKALRPDVRSVISATSGAAADITVEEGDEVKFGRYSLRVLATPGHTNGCVCYVLQGPDAPNAVFTGDTLLIRGCGRTDFQQGSSEQLYRSVHEKLFTLPPDTRVYSGHDYKQCNVSTIGEERLFNPRLTKSVEEFAKIMQDLGLPMPKRINEAVPANMACGVQG
mmetsp:Transcript_32114/g.70294  ORF Transcript_32114/g.70294 Transcript_32114/m.70294 type:complete len:394 (-) Transcript_32114:245-1426(-)|eukprot:CAMPEP_0170624198 /NCGR_PEP_ID=MMETSP0224-20130122/30104_1 /TAXON_ID=285029 /ORGANISM="Togula jolla, Strain CCCM 725" /LENGTH=393 /DNA_ID=CAMNT_0010950703 /DNA_START=44 /DNA_END=1225 /DNA_ORIENTATION=+